jgi:hypothetical protein
MTRTPLDARGPLAGTVEGWAMLLAHAREQRDRLVAEPPSPSFAAEMLAVELTIARRAAALGEGQEVGRALAAAAAWGAAAALCERMPAGTVTFEVASEPCRVLPCGADALTPPALLDGLAAATVVRDLRAIALLSAPGLLQAVHARAGARGAAVGAEAFWPSLAQLFTATLWGEAIDADAFEACRRLLAGTRDSAIDADSLRLLKVPLVDLMQALAGADGPTWRALVCDAVARFEAFYAQPDWAKLDGGMLALHLAALCAIARDRFGHGVDDDLPVLPAFLVEGEAAAASYRLTYAFPPRQVANVRQIHWLLDLDGVPRDARQHRLIEKDGRLIARYSSGGWAEVDEVAAEFMMEPGAEPLDAGELLLVADLHAKQAAGAPSADPAERRRQRWHLEEATAAIDSLLSLVPEGETRVPHCAFTSARGRAVRLAEPGRFDVDRLRAVRETYRRLLAACAPECEDLGQGAEPGTLVGADEPERRAHTEAIAAIEVIKAELAPLVRALSTDRSGTLLHAVRPRPEDYAKAFREPLAAAAAQAFAAVWAEPPSLQLPRPEQTQLILDLAPAGMLGSDNELSRRFPGGYRKLAPYLVPNRVWARWKLVRPGETIGMAYDGLVWLDDHWAWFPKPYRVLAHLVGDDHR